MCFHDTHTQPLRESVPRVTKGGSQAQLTCAWPWPCGRWPRLPPAWRLTCTVAMLQGQHRAPFGCDCASPPVLFLPRACGHGPIVWVSAAVSAGALLLCCCTCATTAPLPHCVRLPGRGRGAGEALLLLPCSPTSPATITPRPSPSCRPPPPLSLSPLLYHFSRLILLEEGGMLVGVCQYEGCSPTPSTPHRTGAKMSGKPIISDNGTGFVKVGYAGENFPHCIVSSLTLVSRLSRPRVCTEGTGRQTY